MCNLGCSSVKLPVGDSHEDPLKNRGEFCLKPAKNAKCKPNHGPNTKHTHTAIHVVAARAAHRSGPAKRPLERGPPRSTATPLPSEVRLARGFPPPSSRVRLARGSPPPSSRVRLVRGLTPPLSEVRLARGSLTSAHAPARVYGHLVL
jgi:hypothetical protein